MLSGLFEIVALQVLDTELTLSLIVLWVQLNDSLIDWDGLVCHVCYEVESFCKPEIGWH
jgi:hypothetical protein